MEQERARDSNHLELPKLAWGIRLKGQQGGNNRAGRFHPARICFCFQGALQAVPLSKQPSLSARMSILVESEDTRVALRAEHKDLACSNPRVVGPFQHKSELSGQEILEIVQMPRCIAHLARSQAFVQAKSCQRASRFADIPFDRV